MNFLSSIFFISIFTTFILANYLFYFALIKFFSIKDKLTKRLILLVIVVLACSFIFSFVFIRTSNLEIANSFYLVSSLWGGFLINYLMATILLFSFSFLEKWKKIKINNFMLALAIFSVATLISVGGIVNALNPRLKEVEVEISNLPTEWEGKKIAHLSDVHIGPINKKVFLDRVVNKINKSKADIVILSGDFFDGSEKGLEFVPGALRNLMAPFGVYFANGNHETYNYRLDFKKILNEGGVRVLEDEVVEIGGLRIMGVNYRDLEEGGLLEMVKFLNKDKNEKPTILIYHTPDKAKEISRLGIDLQLSGHTHAGQIFPMNIITNLIYKGFNHGLYQIGDYSLNISSGAGTWGPIMRTGNYPEIPVIKLKNK